MNLGSIILDMPRDDRPTPSPPTLMIPFSQHLCLLVLRDWGRMEPPTRGRFVNRLYLSLTQLLVDHI